MGPFRFRLARVLDWRNEQCKSEQNRLSALYAVMAQKKTQLDQLLETQLATERRLLAAPSIAAGELQALGESRRSARARELRLRDEIRRCETDIRQQVELVKAAQLKVHLLEKLQSRRLAEHTYAVNRELEELAADTFLAKFAREL